jgi:hypothetical protein
VPVPVRESEAFTVPCRFNVAVRAPVAEGVKVRMMVQDALAAMEPALTQVPPLRAKFVGLVPVMVKKGVARTSAAVPVLETVIVKGPLVVPCNWLPKAPGDGDRPIIGKVPVPVKASDPLTVPEIFKIPDRLPVAVGVKVKITVHEPLTAIVPPLTHVPPLRAKSPEFVPVSVKNGVARTSDAVPLFETVTVIGALAVFCNWLPNGTGLGDRLITGTAGATPVPVKATVSGLEAALVTNTKLAVLLPTVVGVKTTFSEQEADAARLAPQVLPFVLNWPESAPVRLMLAIVSVDVPVFVSVTAWFPLGMFVV